MEILAHFIETLKTLELNIFITNTNLEPLIINQYVPKHIEKLASNPEIEKYIKNITNDLEALNNLLSPITNETKKATKSKNFPKTEPYASFIIDEEPIIKEGHYLQQSFEDIMATSDKEIKPIKRRVPFDYEGMCIHCGVPNEYLYKHTKSQTKYKVCEGTFTMHPHYHEEITHHCPHCESKLELHHDRSNYDVLRCHNDTCSFYLKNKKALHNNQADHLKTNSNSYKLRYHFRLFNFSMKDIKANSPFTINTKIDLDKIHHSKYTVGLALTYYVNYGLSSRKTSKILYEVHGIKLSHQTVVNYAEAVASITENLNKNYDYNLSNTLSFDETYIKVKGKSNYVFFGSDTTNKIITSYRIFAHRTSKNAITTLYESFIKYKEQP
jgi:transposase-like protein